MYLRKFKITCHSDLEFLISITNTFQRALKFFTMKDTQTQVCLSAASQSTGKSAVSECHTSLSGLDQQADSTAAGTQSVIPSNGNTINSETKPCLSQTSSESIQDQIPCPIYSALDQKESVTDSKKSFNLQGLFKSTPSCLNNAYVIKPSSMETSPKKDPRIMAIPRQHVSDASCIGTQHESISQPLPSICVLKVDQDSQFSKSSMTSPLSPTKDESGVASSDTMQTSALECARSPASKPEQSTSGRVDTMCVDSSGLAALVTVLTALQDPRIRASPRQQSPDSSHVGIEVESTSQPLPSTSVLINPSSTLSVAFKLCPIKNELVDVPSDDLQISTTRRVQMTELKPDKLNTDISRPAAKVAAIKPILKDPRIMVNLRQQTPDASSTGNKHESVPQPSPSTFVLKPDQEPQSSTSSITSQFRPIKNQPDSASSDRMQDHITACDTVPASKPEQSTSSSLDRVNMDIPNPSATIIAISQTLKDPRIRATPRQQAPNASSTGIKPSTFALKPDQDPESSTSSSTFQLGPIENQPGAASSDIMQSHITACDTGPASKPEQSTSNSMDKVNMDIPMPTGTATAISQTLKDPRIRVTSRQQAHDASSTGIKHESVPQPLPYTFALKPDQYPQSSTSSFTSQLGPIENQPGSATSDILQSHITACDKVLASKPEQSTSSSVYKVNIDIPKPSATVTTPDASYTGIKHESLPQPLPSTFVVKPDQDPESFTSSFISQFTPIDNQPGAASLDILQNHFTACDTGPASKPEQSTSSSVYKVNMDIPKTFFLDPRIRATPRQQAPNASSTGIKPSKFALKPDQDPESSTSSSTSQLGPIENQPGAASSDIMQSHITACDTGPASKPEQSTSSSMDKVNMDIPTQTGTTTAILQTLKDHTIRATPRQQAYDASSTGIKPSAFVLKPHQHPESSKSSFTSRLGPIENQPGAVSSDIMHSHITAFDTGPASKPEQSTSSSVYKVNMDIPMPTGTTTAMSQTLKEGLQINSECIPKGSSDSRTSIPTCPSKPNQTKPSTPLSPSASKKRRISTASDHLQVRSGCYAAKPISAVLGNSSSTKHQFLDKLCTCIKPESVSQLLHATSLLKPNEDQKRSAFTAQSEMGVAASDAMQISPAGHTRLQVCTKRFVSKSDEDNMKQTAGMTLIKPTLKERSTPNSTAKKECLNLCPDSIEQENVAKPPITSLPQISEEQLILESPFKSFFTSAGRKTRVSSDEIQDYFLQNISSPTSTSSTECDSNSAFSEVVTEENTTAPSKALIKEHCTTSRTSWKMCWDSLKTIKDNKASSTKISDADSDTDSDTQEDSYSPPVKRKTISASFHDLQCCLTPRSPSPTTETSTESDAGQVDTTTIESLSATCKGRSNTAARTANVESMSKQSQDKPSQKISVTASSASILTPAYKPSTTAIGFSDDEVISSLFVEVSKVAAATPVLKGIDINRVIRILLEN
ncbi:Hypothetical predicted protein [Pelobates cultripes]|uniref:Uncharacterized protein n=1 Tax=Pelobates cultripes TaxID=61616 RepID=A0AAD1S2E5_PELCU|nr:Hypothetical predicted protein [Pelobates cultripes]